MLPSGRLGAFLTVCFLLAGGCLGSVESEDPPGLPPGDESDVEEENDTNVSRVEAPDLEEGRAWTYEATGFYNTGEEVTIVVAEATENGYLFAGHEPRDLLEDVAWGRVWQGPMTSQLNPQAPDGSERLRLFDFPLQDGKTWPMGDGTVTATRTTVPTPDGEAEGFLLEREHEDGSTRWTYQEDLGYLTSYEAVTADTTFLSLDLVRVETLEAWTWYERLGDRVDVGGNQPDAATASVPGQASALVVSASAENGSRAVAAPPPPAAPPWMHHVEGQAEWTYEDLPSHAGSWTFSTSGQDGAFAWISAQPVKWTGPGAS